jgi:hypothetical protein
MIQWYKKLWFKIISNVLFRRKYFVYVNTENAFYYVKTTKLFFRSRYIKVIGGRFTPELIFSRWIFKAKTKCKILSLDKAKSTIIRHQNHYSNHPTLKYHQVWQE